MKRLTVKGLLLLSSLVFFMPALPAFSASDAEVALMPPDKIAGQLEKLKKELKQNPSDFTLLKQAGIALHQLNRAKPDLAKLDEANKYFDAALKIKKDDPQVMAWLGSLTTLRAKLETNSGKQTFYVKLGTKQLDKAVKLDPNNIMVLNVRGYNSIELPVFFKRARLGVEDFSKILQLCKAQKAACSDADVALYRKSVETAKKLAQE
jgi:tetratricopeptide (TPR) repeat protein